MTIGVTTTAKNGFGKWATIVPMDFGNALHGFTVLANVHFDVTPNPICPKGTFNFFGIP
jgi:hypothetical protein